MLRVYAKDFVRLGYLLRHMQLSQLTLLRPDAIFDAELLKEIIEIMKSCEQTCSASGLPVSSGVMGRIRQDYEEDPPTYVKAEADFVNLQRCIQAEYGSRWLLYLPEDRAGRYDHGSAPFGDAVAEKFPSADYDVREACKCLGLERDTAAVFHAMRILEKGIVALAQDVGTSLDPAYENWQNILDQIDERVEARYKTMGKGAAKSEEQQRYGKATAEFRHFQVAWRNHVSHGRGTYDQDEAERVLGHVEDFMRHLATWLSEVP